MTTLNIAARIRESYSSKDFENNYEQVLFEQYHDNKGDVINRIISLFNSDNYESEKYLVNWKTINRDQAALIYDFISDNFEDFIKKFRNYYVGSGCLESVSFGEQEEQLTGLHNSATNKDYSIKYLRRVFKEESFYVSKNNYAYYDLSSDGLQINLFANIPLLDNFIRTI